MRKFNGVNGIKEMRQIKTKIRIAVFFFGIFASALLVFPAQASDITEQNVLRLTNEVRQKAGLSSLETDDQLTRAANLKVQDMLDKKYDNKYMIITGHNTLKVENMLEMLKEMMGNNIVIEKNDKDADDAHYTMTPYSFQPKIGQKIVSNEYMDFGQGLLECINEIYQELYHEKCRVG